MELRAPEITGELVEKCALEAWIAYSVRPEDMNSTEDGDYNRASAVRDWGESPTGCTHIGADGFRDVARRVLEAISAPPTASSQPHGAE